MFPLESHATMVVTEGIRLRHEKKCADLAQDANNYPDGNKVALSGEECWSNYERSNPIAVVEQGKEVVRKKIGRSPNTMLLGAQRYAVLKHHPKLIERIKYSMKGVVTVDLLKEIFGVPSIFVGESVYFSDAGVYADIWADVCILAYVPTTGAQRSIYAPAFAYTPQKKGYPQVDQYDEAKKLRLIRSTDIFKPVIVGADAGYLIANTVDN